MVVWRRFKPSAKYLILECGKGSPWPCYSSQPPPSTLGGDSIPAPGEREIERDVMSYMISRVYAAEVCTFWRGGTASSGAVHLSAVSCVLCEAQGRGSTAGSGFYVSVCKRAQRVKPRCSIERSAIHQIESCARYGIRTRAHGMRSTTRTFHVTQTHRLSTGPTAHPHCGCALCGASLL